MQVKKFIRKFSSSVDLFEKYITKTISNKEEISQEKFYQFQRELNFLNKKIDNEPFNYDLNFVSEYKDARVQLINNEINEFSPDEHSYFMISLLETLKKKNVDDNLTLNINTPGIKELSQNPYPYLNPNYWEKQQKICDLTPLGPNKFKSLLSILGSSNAPVENIPQQEIKIEVKEEKKVEVEKKSFDVELTSFDAAQKIKIIKDVRSILNLGLKEAKDIVEKTPVVIAKDLPKEKAEELIAKFKELGCVLTLK